MSKCAYPGCDQQIQSRYKYCFPHFRTRLEELEEKEKQSNTSNQSNDTNTLLKKNRIRAEIQTERESLNSELMSAKRDFTELSKKYSDQQKVIQDLNSKLKSTKAERAHVKSSDLKNDYVLDKKLHELERQLSEANAEVQRLGREADSYEQLSLLDKEQEREFKEYLEMKNQIEKLIDAVTKNSNPERVNTKEIADGLNSLKAVISITAITLVVIAGIVAFFLFTITAGRDSAVIQPQVSEPTPQLSPPSPPENATAIPNDKFDGHVSCPRKECDGVLRLKKGEYGLFYGCSNFRDENCMITAQYPFSCYRCGSSIALRDGKFGKFWGCTNFPECRHTYNYE